MPRCAGRGRTDMDWTSVGVLAISFVVLMALGVPIALCIGLSTVATMLVSMPPDPAVTTTAHRMATGLDSFALLAIPFFILAGDLMNHGGIARRLIDFAKACVGMLPGGLAYVNILAAMLMGAISGSDRMLVSMPPDPAVTTTAHRMATGLDSFALLAIPFFILAGDLMNHGGIARRLIDFAKACVGMLPGGLAYVNILAAMLMGAISG